MDDEELDLIAALSFTRSDLEALVLGVLGSMDRDFRTVVWPANTAEVGSQLVALGWALRRRAVRPSVLIPPDPHEGDESSEGR